MASNIQRIYIKVIEGTETLVPLESRSLGGGKFEIIKNPYLDLAKDPSSIWEFFPGDVVLCETINGDLVAKKLVRSSFPNRRIHELIFLIVKSLGNIQKEEFQEFATEIDRLCKGAEILQKQHPLVKKWLLNNCG